jgi:hypothetical protein
MISHNGPELLVDKINDDINNMAISEEVKK